MQAASKTVLQKILEHPALLLVLGIVCSAGAIMLAGSALAHFAANFDIEKSAWQNLLSSIVLAGACVLGYYYFVRFIERKPWTDFAPSGALPEFGYGVLVGASAMALTVGAIAAFGGYHIVGHNLSADVAINTAAIAVISGITEEILLRGVVFRFLEQWLGSIIALMLSALLFGILHLGNPNASWLAAFAIALEAGVLLGAIYMVTRRLWAAIGLHMAWNSVQGGVFGIKVSGTDVDGLIVSEPRGSDWLTGGLFGAEASIPAIVICTSIGVYFLWRAHKMGQFVPFGWFRFKTGEASQIEAATPAIG
jgi:membrane protease YdiL (CAAX protease family)